jgi:hypothetical protein
LLNVHLLCFTRALTINLQIMSDNLLDCSKTSGISFVDDK